MSQLNTITKRLWFKIVVGIGITLCLSAGILVLLIHAEYQKLESDDPTVWESVIREFEKEDKEHTPIKNAVLFIGSSSIRFWRNLDKDMAPTPVIKRGFGGSKLRDIIYYADRIVFPYKPKAIVLFAGSNDISGRANDKTPETVLQNFIEFTQLVHSQLPHCQIYYLPITPTTGRWQIWPQANKANTLIKKYMATHKNLHYLDVTHHFLTTEGTPNTTLLWWDGVHLNSSGYKIWEQAIKNELQKQVATSAD